MQTTSTQVRSEQILDIAERLVQTRGFNGFSYADVAAALEITKPALHYHFATKAELGRALVGRYAQRFDAALSHADTSASGPPARLAAYCGLYTEVLRDGRMCLCGMLAAEYQTLPEVVQREVMAYFQRNEACLVGVLDAGRSEGVFDFAGSSRDAARFVVGELEGAMLLARLHDDVARFEVAIDRLLGGLRSDGPR